MKIGNLEVGKGNKCLIVAELSANHNQNLDIAIKTIREAKKAGADAIKLQTYTPDTLTIDSDQEYFKIKEGLWKGKTLYELYKNAYTPWEWHSELKKVAKEEGLLFFSTPFDKSAVDFLENLNVPCYKIASFEIKDLDLIEYAASKGKPMIISTGIATLENIKDAVEACKKAGNSQIIILKCTSSYPAKIEDSNLKTIQDIKEKFECEVGLSDHTKNISVAITSIAFGAKIIETHFVLDKDINTPDSKFSMGPIEFKKMVSSIRDAEKSIGKIDYSLSEEVKKSIIFSRSLFVVKDIANGEEFNYENVRSIRPGYGMHPKNLKKIIGKKASKDIKKGTPLMEEMIK